MFLLLKFSSGKSVSGLYHFSIFPSLFMPDGIDIAASMLWL